MQSLIFKKSVVFIAFMPLALNSLGMFPKERSQSMK